jgi:anti-anti-sigma factor
VDRAPSDFDVEVLPHGADGILVAPRGELDISTAPRLREALLALRPPPQTLVLDLRGLSFLDTSALQLVLEERQRAEEEGRRLLLVRGSDELHRLFELAGLDAHLPFIEHPDEA